jgi:hypothetical protein
MAKIKTIMQSRKFWVMISGLVAIAAAFSNGSIDEWQAIQAIVAAGAAYSVGTGIESGLSKQG